MQPEKSTVYVNGEQQVVETAPMPQESPRKSQKSVSSFLLKEVVLIAIIYALISTALGIIFIGLLPISVGLVLLALMLGKEVYRDVYRQLDSQEKSLAIILTCCTYLTIFGAAAMVLFVVVRTKNSKIS